MKRIEDIIAENERRKASVGAEYCQATGVGCAGERCEVMTAAGLMRLPVAMCADPERLGRLPVVELERMRIRYDFEFWAWRCVKVRHKVDGRRIPLTLNAPQRRMLAVMEADRQAGRPVRVIVLKARQWGCSTLVAAYFAWIQIAVRRNWNSLLCAHIGNTAGIIRQMYSDLLADYPEELWTEGDPPALLALGGAPSTRRIAGRGATITIGTSHSPDSLRGIDASLAHLSEVAFWMDTPKMSPTDLIRTVCSGIPLVSDTVVVFESTANGAGSFFHDEWLRAKDGRSDKRAVFVPWYEIDFYSRPVDDPAALWESLDDYERGLWERGLTLEQINWYHSKRREVTTHAEMMTEFPSDDVEAFVYSGCGVFAPEHVAALRDGCSDPVTVGELMGAAPTGPAALRNLRFVADSAGALSVWEFPRGDARPGEYVVAVDVGGRSAAADWSVIAVLDRRAGDKPAVVAQWRSHIDHDRLGWMAASIARWYGEALLVVESNTLETESAGASSYILEQISRHYPRLYSRTVRDTSSPQPMRRYGFHTNRATKAMIISGLIAAVREGAYGERDVAACSEMSTYRQRPNGSYAARDGCHDDILMTRAIALYVAQNVATASPAPWADYVNNRW